MKTIKKDQVFNNKKNTLTELWKQDNFHFSNGVINMVI